MQIEPSELAKRLRSAKPPQLLDVRRPEEYALVALPGARLIPLHALPGRLGELADWKDIDVVVYCHHGVRSLQATEFLRQNGFSLTQSLTGGIDAWAVQIDPTLRRY